MKSLPCFLIYIATSLIIVIQCASNEQIRKSRSPSPSSKTTGVPDLNRSPSPNSRTHGGISPFRGHHDDEHTPTHISISSLSSRQQSTPSLSSGSFDSGDYHQGTPSGSHASSSHHHLDYHDGVTSPIASENHPHSNGRVAISRSPSPTNSRSQSFSPLIHQQRRQMKGKDVIIRRPLKRRKKDGSGPSGTAGIDHPVTPPYSVHDSDFYIASSIAGSQSTSSATTIENYQKKKEKKSKEIKLGGQSPTSSSSNSSVGYASDTSSSSDSESFVSQAKSQPPRSPKTMYSPNPFRSKSTSPRIIHDW